MLWLTTKNLWLLLEEKSTLQLNKTQNTILSLFHSLWVVRHTRDMQFRKCESVWRCHGNGRPKVMNRTAEWNRGSWSPIQMHRTVISTQNPRKPKAAVSLHSPAGFSMQAMLLVISDTFLKFKFENNSQSFFSYWKQNWRQKDPKTSSTWRWLQWRPGKISPERKFRNWQCPCASEFNQSKRFSFTFLNL